MEDAYTGLYQEFLRLRSLCLKQAAMLQHLTEMLRRQQDHSQGSASLLFGDLENLVSIPVQEQSWLNAYPEGGHSQTVLTQTPGGDCSDILLATGMDQLQLSPVQPGVTPGGHGEGAPLDPPGCNGAMAPPNIWEDLRQAEQRGTSGQMPQQLRRPWASSFLNSEMLSQAGGMLMSGVTLQSHVCEFCHAVFPGHTTTRGEFLRHLTTHVT